MMAQSGSGGGEIEVPNGVYIQDTDGVLWQKAAWDGSATPNGVAVVADECRFVIAMEERTYTMIGDSQYSNNLTLPRYNSYSDAVTDYNGYSNTSSIVSTFGYASNLAAYYCKSYTFPNGSTGYLGSAGEWNVAINNQWHITNCMGTVSGKAFNNYFYWTSTRGPSIILESMRVYPSFWGIYWDEQYWEAVEITTNTFAARPFTELGEVTGIVEA